MPRTMLQQDNLRLTRLTSKGQMTIPEEYRQALGLSQSDYVALRLVSGGVLVSKATVTVPETEGERALREMVIALGRKAQTMGITEEEQLPAAGRT